MRQHVSMTGISGAVVEGIFKEIAVTEMKHAEEIAESLVSLGENPTKNLTLLCGVRAWMRCFS